MYVAAARVEFDMVYILLRKITQWTLVYEHPVFITFPDSRKLNK
jgi:sRNA-binding regulator protein Hfq